jgi:hypothetical protein
MEQDFLVEMFEETELLNPRFKPLAVFAEAIVKEVG